MQRSGEDSSQSHWGLSVSQHYQIAVARDAYVLIATTTAAIHATLTPSAVWAYWMRGSWRNYCTPTVNGLR
jgi:hypothetical protein